LREFVEEHDVIYVVELNFDGQMRQLIQLYMPERATSIRSVAHCDGLPLTARFVAEAIMGKETNTNGHNG
jgi:2-oxoglutarate ferredoxin oxidoreductase subunit alpha